MTTTTARAFGLVAMVAVLTGFASVVHAAPTLTRVAISSDDTDPGYAKVGSVVTVSFSSSLSTVASATVDIASATGIIATDDGSGTWSASYTMQSTDAEGYVPFTIHFTDSNGDTDTRSTQTDGAVLFDATAPRIQINGPGAGPQLTESVMVSMSEEHPAPAPSHGLTQSVTTGTTCDASLTFGAYADLHFSSAADSGKRVCYQGIDAAGNTTYALSDAVLIGDPNAPPTPATLNAPDLDDATDTGSSVTDSITSDTMLIFSGRADASALVTLYSDGVAVASSTADGTGDWTVQADGFTEGVHAITATQTELGAESAPSPALSVTVDTTAPDITLNGDADSTIDFDSTYTDPGATAADTLDSAPDVAIGGETVDTSTAGSYHLSYTATDAAGNVSRTLTRVVTVNPQPAQPIAVVGASSGGGGSSSSHRPSSAIPGQVLGVSTYNFMTDLSLGSSGVDVNELQKVLIAGGYLQIPAPVGTYGPMTQAAVRAYQTAHGISPTGSVGFLTRSVLNGSSSSSADSERQTMLALLAQLLAQVAVLQAQLAALT